MIEFVLKREPTRNGGTFGRLYLGQPASLLPEVQSLQPLCETLEDEIRPYGVKVHGRTCIPPGRYRLRLVTSPRFGPDTPSLDDVPGFSYIRIHAGNVVEDSDGCILVGEQRSRTSKKRPWIGKSRIALARLVEQIKRMQLLQHELYIRIENPAEEEQDGDDAREETNRHVEPVAGAGAVDVQGTRGDRGAR